MCKSNQNAENVFEGSYKGNHAGISSVADLRVDGNRLRGEVTLNDKVATINGTIDGLSTTGTLKDEETGQLYNYTGSLDGDELRLTCTSDEDNSQAVELIMYRKEHSPSSSTDASDQGLNPEVHPKNEIRIWSVFGKILKCWVAEICPSPLNILWSLKKMAPC